MDSKDLISQSFVVCQIISWFHVPKDSVFAILWYRIYEFKNFIDGWVMDGWMADVWMDGWVMDGWMDGWVGNNLFFFCLFLENYSIYDADCFHAP